MSDKLHRVTLVFDDKSAAENFFAYWLDGGGDGGGNIDWDTDKWNKAKTLMRIKGTGWPIDEQGEVLTPERENEAFDKKYKNLMELSKK